MLLNDSEMHRAGATIRHVSPFSNIEVPEASTALDPHLIEEWIRPFYLMDVAVPDEKVAKRLQELWKQIDDRLVEKLLSAYDWRPRIVGAYFVALRHLSSQAGLIGRLLVRSDVCMAARGYCIALAELNLPIGNEYLRKYLDYYLRQINVWFDQGEVLAAVLYLDGLNGTNIFGLYRDDWMRFVANKPGWDIEEIIRDFNSRMLGLESLRSACEA